MSAEPVRVLHSPPQAVVVVGAGGTGGILTQQLCRLLYGIADLSDRARDAPRLVDDEEYEEEFDPYSAGAPELIIVDGDSVEPSNLRRQFFVDADSHKNKAIVLAERYSAAFGLPVSAYPHYLTPQISRDDLEEVLPARSVVVGAVDNAATRRFLHERLDTYADVVYLDSGNAGVPATANRRASELEAGEAGYDGQVVCGARMDHHKVLPFPAEVFPDLIDVEDPEDRLPTDIPCGEAIVSNPQRQVTNVLAATVLLSYLTPILTEGVVPNSMTFFDARRGYMRSRTRAQVVT
ncbi:MAG: ThiF family adenylyltransferase [Rubrobacter sp.]|nr:ThiF family adenylyltransferase [Rubrobacter sp.]